LALLGDLLRAILGLLLVLVPLLVVPLHPVLVVGLAGLAILFLVFAIRTILRQTNAILVDERAIASTGPLAAEIPWAELDRLALRYYATRRDRAGGWMQLTLRAGRRRLSIDSQIEDFEAIASRAARAAAENGVELDDATRSNLASLDITLPSAITERPGLTEARG
jgi:hypothetical protein